jgi:hypothetical protein
VRNDDLPVALFISPIVGFLPDLDVACCCGQRPESLNEMAAVMAAVVH